MTRNPLSPAGEHASNAPLRPEFGQQKTPVIAARGWYFVRATGKPAQAPVALRNPPKHNFEVSRNEFAE